MITPDAEIHRILRHPEVWKNHVFVILVKRREDQNECRNICGGGEVKAAIADTALKVIIADRESARIPFVHWHPADGLLYPLIQA